MKSLPRRLGLLLAAALLPLLVHAQSSMVRLHTTQGVVDLKLLSDAPITVGNFLTYLRAGDYNDGVVHRNSWTSTPVLQPFVIQAGWYRWTTAGLFAITTRAPIPNEFSVNRSNIRGTVAMAKQPNNANSATSQWFINMSNNAANLDSQNGGFSVFARVTTPGMETADRIANLVQVNVSNPPWPDMPVQGWQVGTQITRSHAVLITEARELTTTTESDRIFNYLEAQYPQYLSPAKGSGGEALGYQYRYYSGSNAYVGTKDGKVWYLVPAINGNINELGLLADWLGMAAAAGY